MSEVAKIVILQLLLRSPEIARAALEIFRTDKPTDAQWDTLFSLHRTWEQVEADALKRALSVK